MFSLLSLVEICFFVGLALISRALLTTMKKARIKHIAVWAVAALLVAACASIGSPDGGPYDETPPVFLGSEPEPFALGVKDKRVTLEFD